MAAATEVSVPDLGDFAEVPVIEIRVAAGNVVSAEDPLVTLESDKATMDIPSPAPGTVRELRVKVGDLVSRGSPILLLDTGGTDVEPPPLTDQQEPPALDAADPVAAAREPAARSASSAQAAAVPAPAAEAGPPVTAVETGPPADFDGVHAGPALHRSWLNVPHVTHDDKADITDLDAYRRELDTAARAEGYRVTLLAFLLKASVSALREFPKFNSSLTPDKDALIYKSYYHLGVAVDTPEGLVVPVIRDVDRKGITELSRELGALSAKARDGKLDMTDLQGGCFTISSLGGIGGTSFTPIVNAPEVAILGVVRARTAPVWDGTAFVPRLMLPISLSYDHRVIDGALAARFARYLCHLLEDVRRLVL